MNKAIIIGAGTYGQVYAEYLKNTYDILGYIDDNYKLLGKLVNKIPVIGNTEHLFTHISRDTNVFVPIGNNSIRVNFLAKLKEKGFLIPSFIHPEANIHETTKIGEAVYVLPGTYIMPFVSLGNYTMISMGVNIAHHTTIDLGCFFSQGTNVGASIHLKEKSYCGIGSTIMTGVKIVGFNSLIGAGAVVIKDVPDNAVVAGVPAKVLKYKE